MKYITIISLITTENSIYISLNKILNYSSIESFILILNLTYRTT